MKTRTAINKFAFNKLIECFIQRTAHLYILNRRYGKGYAQIFDLEKGLQVRFWNFCLLNEVELYNDLDCKNDNTYYTLAFFLSTKGLVFSDNDTFLNENTVWDTIFISNGSNYKMNMSPMAPGHCLSISFSKKWLDAAVFETNDSMKKLKERMDAAESFSLHESMSEGDKMQVTELMDTTWKKSLGSFYIHSFVLKIICNFFNRIKDRGGSTFKKDPVEACITEVETYLNNHVACPLPDLKTLAQSFSISERTLARHFKKKHGVNVSTYFMCKKMEYAGALIREKNMRFDEVASLAGYKNPSNFKCMFRKYKSHKYS